MSLVSKAINALFNGVSQQPATMRLPSQCESLINGYPSVADGLAKRPSTQHIALLSGLASDDAFIHVINRDADERYVVIIGDETLKVYSMTDGAVVDVVYEDSALFTISTAYVLGDVVRPTAANGFHYRVTTAGTTAGSEPTWGTTLGGTTVSGTVTFTAIPNYLALPAGASASESYAVVTVGDYSFVVNKTVTVESAAMYESTPAPFSSWYFPDNWTQAGDNTRYYVEAPGIDQGKAQLISELPGPGDITPPEEGDYYEIVGNESTGFSKHYVIYRGGVWVETHVVDGAIRLDEATMPHALVREEDGDFHFRQFGWVPRLVGDDISNAPPSFVGKTIVDIGYHKNRLAVAAGENIAFSCSGDYGNFFRTTVTQLLDSDRVDTSTSTAKVSEINHILSSQNGLMFFSDSAQFVLNVDQLLTPSSVSIDVATSYEMNPIVPPINVGQDIYFVTPAGDFSRVREYTLGDGEELTTDATDITAHVPRYLPADIFRLAGSSNEDILLALSSAPGHENRVYVYKFFYSGGEKVQSAWFYWQFADDDVVRNIEILDSEVYFIIERADGMYLEKMNVQSTDYPLALTFDVLLDRRHLFTGGQKSYDGSVYTTFTLPYPVTAAERDYVRLVLADGATAGRLLEPGAYVWLTSTTVKATGNWTATEVLGGLNYELYFQFSEQFFPRSDGVVTTGRYQLRTFTIYFEDTAFFSTVVAPYGLDATTEEVVTNGLSDFTGKTLGNEALTLDAPVFATGTYAFQIYGNSRVATVALTNDQPFQSRFVSAEVEGFYSNRSRAV